VKMLAEKKENQKWKASIRQIISSSHVHNFNELSANEIHGEKRRIYHKAFHENLNKFPSDSEKIKEKLNFNSAKMCRYAHSRRLSFVLISIARGTSRHSKCGWRTHTTLCLSLILIRWKKFK
jgi:hypothetical protein